MGRAAQGEAAAPRKDAGVKAAAPGGTTRGLAERVGALGWSDMAAQLDARGYAQGGPLLSDDECAQLIAQYGDDGVFRSRIVMERHNFGVGEYAYYAEPLPALVAALREALYERLAPVANRWTEALARPERYPPRLPEFLARCHRAGQTRPTPLLLHYRAGGFNCLHRDLYGELRFPLQAMVLLSQPGADFEGGEFLLVENRARQQSRAVVVHARRGELLLFAVDERPAQGRRGVVRASLRHGVSPVHAGERYAMGLIFHDAS